MYEELIYDPVRDFIKERRKDDVSWEEIYNGEGELESILNLNNKFNHWPQVTVDIWHEIVEQQKKSEKEILSYGEQDTSATIHDQFQENAINEIPRGKNSSWMLYKKKLKDKGFQESSINEIESATFKLIKRLSLNTNISGTRKGLVIGNVQSGKTANMAALIAMAADWGWNMFIILSGTIENLRQQTQKRFQDDLIDNSCQLQWYSLEGLRPRQGTRSSHLNFSRKSTSRYFTVILKNPSHLRNVIKWLQEDPNTQELMRILVIDDEADQAGINTANVNEKTRRTINNLICSLINGNNFRNEPIETKYNAMNYIAYTATPYANILNEHSPESTYPRNFISALGVSKEYFGPQQIFGCEDTNYSGLDIIREITSEDLNDIKEIHNDNTTIDIPDSLKDSICWFLCCVACQRFRGAKKPVSMLVHTSQKTSHHQYISNAIENWINSNSTDDIIRYCKVVWDYEVSTFDKNILREEYPDYSRRDQDILPYPKFKDVETELIKLLSGNRISHIPLGEEGIPYYHEGIHLCIDNCQNNGQIDGMIVRLMYPSEEQDIARAFIVVGGQTLSRGLTIEGLVSTYFLRSVKQADTLMQMGRWFGYRKDYETLPRIWMTERVKEQFEFLSVLDKSLRDEIKRMEDLGITPENYGPRVTSHPLASFIRITAKNRMQEGVPTDYSGVATQTTTFDNDEKKLVHNLNITRSFLQTLGNPEQTKPCNKHAENSKVWRNIVFENVRAYLNDFKFSTRQAAFNDIQRMLQWFETMTKNKTIENWNVVLVGIDKKYSAGTWEVSPDLSITKISRAQKKHNTENILNIGALRAPKDILADVDLENVSSEIAEMVKEFKSKGGLQLRDKAGLNKTPQLLIYIIDKNSPAGQGSKTRKDLNALNDVVGICITVPYGDRKSDNRTVAIPINNNLFDYTEDIDGTNEN